MLFEYLLVFCLVLKNLRDVIASRARLKIDEGVKILGELVVLRSLPRFFVNILLRLFSSLNLDEYVFLG